MYNTEKSVHIGRPIHIQFYNMDVVQIATIQILGILRFSILLNLVMQV